LPSTRTLVTELGVSRITIVSAFEQLTAEGFLRSRAGDGTYVDTLWSDAAPQRPTSLLRSFRQPVWEVSR
jgi:GntR family transcriptional regulator/MocR family aminotransferase